MCETDVIDILCIEKTTVACAWNVLKIFRLTSTIPMVLFYLLFLTVQSALQVQSNDILEAHS